METNNTAKSKKKLQMLHYLLPFLMLKNLILYTMRRLKTRCRRSSNATNQFRKKEINLSKFTCLFSTAEIQLWTILSGCSAKKNQLRNTNFIYKSNDTLLLCTQIINQCSYSLHAIIYFIKFNSSCWKVQTCTFFVKNDKSFHSPNNWVVHQLQLHKANMV